MLVMMFVFICFSSRFSMIIEIVLISEFEVSIMVFIRFSIINEKYLVELNLKVSFVSGGVNVVMMMVLM